MILLACKWPEFVVVDFSSRWKSTPVVKSCLLCMLLLCWYVSHI